MAGFHRKLEEWSKTQPPDRHPKWSEDITSFDVQPFVKKSLANPLDDATLEMTKADAKSHGLPVVRVLEEKLADSSAMSRTSCTMNSVSR